jgi:transketolase
MTVVHPCDDLSAEELTVQLKDIDGPSYMRTVRNKTKRLYDDDSVGGLEIGSGSVLREGRDVAILSCGVMVEQSLKAASDLSKEGIESTVVDMHTIKPLDAPLLDMVSEKWGCLVTAEDHSVIGGLGGAVAEWLSQNRPIPLEMVGVADRFGESGDPDDLMRIMGLTSTEISGAAKRSIYRRNTIP